MNKAEATEAAEAAKKIVKNFFLIVFGGGGCGSGRSGCIEQLKASAQNKLVQVVYSTPCFAKKKTFSDLYFYSNLSVGLITSIVVV